MGVFGGRHMKFKNGVEVEACSNEPGFAGAWFEGVIVSHEEGVYKVQYDKFETDEGQPLIEELDYSQIRPRPPEINITNWAVGDEIEVLDKDCWWKGVVSKILPHNFYGAHFPGYDTDMTCPHSNIRPRQEWQNCKWSLSLQARKWDTFKRGSAFEESTHEIDEGFPYEEYNKVKKFRCSKLARDRDTRALDARGIFYDVSLMDTDNKECSVSTTGSRTAFALAFRDKRDKVLSKKDSTYYATKELTAHRKFQKQNEVDLAYDHNVSLHKLELSAYRSVLQAFHAQGSLSWGREFLLTNLHLELHISCQEHTFVLEQLSRGL